MNVIMRKNLTENAVSPGPDTDAFDATVLRLQSGGEVEYRVSPFVRWAFYLFIASIPFETIDLGIPLETTMITLGILVIAVLTQPSLVLRNPPYAFGFFAIYLVTCFLAFAIDTPAELYGAAIWQLMVISQLILMSWMAFNIFKSESTARTALFILAVSCVLLAVLQLLGISHGVEEVGGKGRVTAFGFHPNNIARIFALGLLSLAGLAYAVKKSAFKSRIWIWAPVAILGLTIVQTGSRGGLLALGAGLSVFVFKPGAVSTKVRNIAVVLIASILFVLIVFQSEISLSRFESAVEDGNLARREQIYPEAWNMIKEKPLLGWGAKAGEYELGERLSHPEEDSKNAHNLILYVLMSVGIVGFLPLMWGIWLTLKVAWRARRGQRGVLPLSLLITVLVANMSSVWINNKMHWIVFAYALSSLFAEAGGKRIYLRKNLYAVRNEAAAL